MDAQEEIPYGEKVRLILDYIVPNSFTYMQVGDYIYENDEELIIHQIGQHDMKLAVIPAQTEGTVGTSIYCHDIYDHEIECPVEWDFHSPGIAKFQGTPWKLLEFID
ncbi:hypothetical protein IIB50_02250 [Patescibacteria group bacterium]|nr:hypothetical protein [Patescibacteria group bacterium]